MPEPMTTSVQSTVPSWVADRLDAIAEEENRSVSNLIDTILRKWLKERDDDKK